MLSDILPPLANLSRAFQRKDLEFTVIKPLVQATKATIDSLLLTSGEHFHSLPTALLMLRSSSQVHTGWSSSRKTFMTSICLFYQMSSLGFGIFDPADLPQDLSLLAYLIGQSHFMF